MKTATANPANSRANSAVTAPPPPPAKRGLISGVLLAGLAALALVAAPDAHAQANRTLTITATGDNGDRSTDAGLQVHEGDVVTITIAVDGLTAGLLIVSNAYSGTASNIDDFSSTSRAADGSFSLSGLIIRIGQLSRSRDITITNDDRTENDETLVFTFEAEIEGGTDTVTITPPALTITILGNDGQAFSIESDAATIAEDGGNVTFTVTMVGETPGAAVTVDWAATGAGITSGDYTLSGADTDGTLSFAAPGAQTLVFAITDDSDSESDETLTLTLSNPSGGATLTTASASTVIEDNDAVRTLTVTGPGSINEGAAGTYTVNLARTAFTSPTAVTWTVTHGDTTDADFAAVTGRITFPTQTTFTVTPADDNFVESAEAFTVQLSVADDSLDGGTAFGDAVSVSITDNDTAGLVITPSALSVPESGEAEYTVRLATRPVDDTASVTVAITVGGTAVATAVPTSLTFAAAAWNTPQTVTVTAAMNAEVHDTATLTHTVTGTGEYASVADVPLTVTIIARPAAQATHELLLPEVTRAVADGVFGAIAARAGEFHGGGGGSAGFSLNGRSTWSDIAANQARAVAAGDGALSRHPRSPSPRHPRSLSPRHPRSLLSGGDLDAKQLLRGLEFASPVSMGASHGNHGHAANLAFWGGGDYRDFGGEDGDDDWDGAVFSLRFGVDGAVRDNLRAGLMLSYSDAETEYTRVDSGTTTTGDYELEMTAVSPYLRWNLGGGHAWASVSYGSGEVEVRPDDGETAANDVTMTGAAFGGGRKLLAQGGRELSVRADAFVASSEVEGDGDANAAGIDEDLDVDANRVRVALAWSYPGRFADGRLAPAFDLGLRHDGGDGRTGAGLELGGALRYRAADAGLTLEGNARALLGHSGDHRGWGVGGLVRVQNGADGQGLAVSIAPSYGGIGDALGAAGSGYAGDSPLWRGGAAGAGRSIATPVARLDAEVGYGVPMSGGSRFSRAFGFGGGGKLFSDGLLTPYSALRIGDANRDYRLGVRWTPAPRLALDVFARHANGTAADNALAVEGQLRF